MVLVNYTDEEAIMVQPYGAKWNRLKIVHVPMYQSRDGYVDTPTQEKARERVPYSLIKFQVELMRDGDLTYRASRAMQNGGWGLYMEAVESVNTVMREATLQQREDMRLGALTAENRDGLPPRRTAPTSEDLVFEGVAVE